MPGHISLDDRFMVKLTANSNSFPASLLQEPRTWAGALPAAGLIWLQGNLPPDAAAFYAGLLLGYQNLLSDSWREHLNRAGVTHLLSISGLHLGLVSLLVFLDCEMAYANYSAPLCCAGSMTSASLFARTFSSRNICPHRRLLGLPPSGVR